MSRETWEDLDWRIDDDESTVHDQRDLTNMQQKPASSKELISDNFQTDADRFVSPSVDAPPESWEDLDNISESHLAVNASCSDVDIGLGGVNQPLQELSNSPSCRHIEVPKHVSATSEPRETSWQDVASDAPLMNAEALVRRCSNSSMHSSIENTVQNASQCGQMCQAACSQDEYWVSSVRDQACATQSTYVYSSIAFAPHIESNVGETCEHLRGRPKLSDVALDHLQGLLHHDLPYEDLRQAELVVEDERRTREFLRLEKERKIAELERLPDWRRESATLLLNKSLSEQSEPSVPEWRRDACTLPVQCAHMGSESRRKLNSNALGLVRWLLEKEAVARGCEASRAAELDERTVQDGTCQTDSWSNGSSTAFCAICLQAPSTQAFVPCGHHCLCDICAKSTHKRCPMCRRIPVGIYRIFAGFELLAVRQEHVNRIRTHTSCADDIPEWRRSMLGMNQGVGRTRKSQLQADSVVKMQQILLANTTKIVLHRDCVAKEAQCQTDLSFHEMEQCALCKLEPATHAALPCGHLCMCANCNYSSSVCPFCNGSKYCGGVRIFGCLS